ncbi:hypothetical protein VSDG_00246 [Cytospora chrysosperma]|uniref:Peptide hydrolase n=1 Tax=Cytospora chrysosperma TaxID=252740 RepID=A0A423WQQ1_CYTCH|nr:hypothetical protein VSDG_00246 [Valsa sordida]
MRTLCLLTYAGLASALVVPCLPRLGPEFCPSSQILSNNNDTFYDAFLKEHPAIFPNSTTQNDILEKLFPQLNKARMEKDLRELTDPDLFKNRYCFSKFGPWTQHWILDKLHNDTAPSVYVRLVGNQTPQNSVVVKVPGLSNNSISVGAHMDSISNRQSRNDSLSDLIAPGADDNGSGTVVVLEVFRQLLSHVASVGALQNEVQFHWYGAEEIGLVGSKQVFSDMRSKSFPLKAMLNLDMVGYPGGGFDKIGVQQDHVDKNLTAFMTTLLETYTTASAGRITCGYPCSDHASAHTYNYSSAMIGESAYIKGDPSNPSSNPFAHSANDTIENDINFDYMMEFARLALAFVVELGQYTFE